MSHRISRLIYRHFAIIALVFSPALHAAAAWDREPTSVLGIQLGAPLPEVPLCKSARDRKYQAPDKLCAEFAPFPVQGRVVTSFLGYPLPDLLSSMTAAVFEGVVASLQATAHHNRYTQLRAALVERYGDPMMVDRTTVKTKAGVEWPSETLTWTGAVVRIRLVERFNEVDKSALLVSHMPSDLKAAAASQNAVKQAAEQL